MNLRKFYLLSATLTLFSVSYGATANAARLITGGTEINTANSLRLNSMHGYDFTPTTAQTLTKLGFWDQGSNGLPRGFQVGVWETSTQTLLASATIDSTDTLDSSVVVEGGSWRFETLTSPVNLTTGTSYTIAFQVGSIALSTTDTLVLDYPSLIPGSDITIPNTVRTLVTTSFTFPTSTVANSSFRANPNAELVATAIPEPTTLLASLGVLAMGRVFKRRQKLNS